MRNNEPEGEALVQRRVNEDEVTRRTIERITRIAKIKNDREKSRRKTTQMQAEPAGE